VTIALSVRFDILERDSYTCRFCGKRAPETELEVDHIMPRSKGGSDDASNLVTAGACGGRPAPPSACAGGSN
jgi:5-methylcytosine-specific restriction endonuclease McrA